jgi:hypothetical protein
MIVQYASGAEQIALAVLPMPEALSESFINIGSSKDGTNLALKGRYHEPRLKRGE